MNFEQRTNELHAPPVGLVSIMFTLINQMHRTCGVHSKLTYPQIVLDKSLFLFSSWFSNASLIFVLSHTHNNLLSHLKRLRLQTRDPSLNVLTQLPFTLP